MSETSAQAELQTLANPLLKAWRTPFETPPFAEIQPEHFLPAFEQAFADHSAEVAAITHDPALPDFDNTITALERSGKLLSKVAAVFYDLVSAHSNPAILEIDKEMSLRMARHWNPIMMNAVLFGRIAMLHEKRASLGLTGEQLRLLERTLYPLPPAPAPASTRAPRPGWPRSTSALAHLGTSFSHHLLGDEQDWSMELGEDDRAGLSDTFVAAAKAAAAERSMAGKAIVTLSRSSVEPFLQSSARRDLREKVYKAFTARGDNGNANDNNETIVEILTLREESAKILRLPDLRRLPPRGFHGQDAGGRARPAGAGLEAGAGAGARRPRRAAGADRGGGRQLRAWRPWDWRYYAEKLRQRRRQFRRLRDQALSGARPHDRGRLRLRHPPVRRHLRGAQGHPGLAPGRPGLGGQGPRRQAQGAVLWRLLRAALEALRRLDDLAARPAEARRRRRAAGHQCLQLRQGRRRRARRCCRRTMRGPCSTSSAHGLHGMLSDVTYPVAVGHLCVHRLRRAALAALRALAGAARGAAALRPRTTRPGRRCRTTCSSASSPRAEFNQGFATVEFVSSALVDLEFHTQPAAASRDVRAFEKQELEKIGMPAEISLRHRPTQFGHIFSGDHYASGYYSYMWSEVMDADAFGAFEEAGDIFDPATAKRLHDDIYSSGGSRDPEEAYVAFRGREPEPDALLRRRGLLETPRRPDGAAVSQPA